VSTEKGIASRPIVMNFVRLPFNENEFQVENTLEAKVCQHTRSMVCSKIVILMVLVLDMRIDQLRGVFVHRTEICTLTTRGPFCYSVNRCNNVHDDIVARNLFISNAGESVIFTEKTNFKASQ